MNQPIPYFPGRLSGTTSSGNFTSHEAPASRENEGGGAPSEDTSTKAQTQQTVVFFDHTAMMSGGEIALLHLLQHLDTRRYYPVVVLSADGPLHAKLVESGIETHVLPLDESVGETRKDNLGLRGLLRPRAALTVLRYTFRLARFLKVREARLLHTNSLKSDVIGGLAGRLARVPVIWHLRDRIATDYLPGPAVTGFRWLARLLPTCILANSQATLQTLQPGAFRNEAVVPAGRLQKTLRVVHDGIPATDASNAPASPVADPLIGLVGRLSPWKGQHVFLAAAALVHRQFPKVRFQIIGSAMFGEEAYEAEIKQLCATLGLSDCVEFTGYRTDVQALIGQLDVLVHASTIGEPFGQVVVEGMMAGKPVVATNGGGVPEIVLDGVTGWLVPMGESAPMAAAILRLLGDPEGSVAMGAAGRQRVLDHFTIEITARKVEAVYEQML